jgi:hypothetical protein
VDSGKAADEAIPLSPSTLETNGESMMLLSMVEKAIARYAKKLKRAEKAFKKNPSKENKFEVEWCQEHIKSFEKMRKNPIDRRKKKYRMK